MKLLLYSIILCSGIILSLSSCCDCKNERDEAVIPVVGKFNYDEWQKAAGWDDYTAGDYKPNEDKVSEIWNVLKTNEDIHFVCVSGNWCSDSEEGMPKIYKLLNAAGYDINKIEIYGVDRQKTEPTGTADKYDIEKVPTLLIFKGDIELGRIVESPILGWEDDLLTILNF